MFSDVFQKQARKQQHQDPNQKRASQHLVRRCEQCKADSGVQSAQKQQCRADVSRGQSPNPGLPTARSTLHGLVEAAVKHQNRVSRMQTQDPWTWPVMTWRAQWNQSLS